MKTHCIAVFFCAALSALPLRAQSEVVWNLATARFAAPAVPTVYGAPQLSPSAKPSAISFNGRDDGYLVPLNPVAGWKSFSIRAKIRPDASGPEAQRFLHIEDGSGQRITMEIRLAKDGSWSLDTFLKGPAPHQLTLTNPSLHHYSGVWHDAMLRYDGKIMSSWVDGKRELTGPVEFPAMGPGQTSVGVRMNRVYWYKGAIAELRFAPQ